jgi:aminopeptidase-like protein
MTPQATTVQPSAELGLSMHALMSELFPICRSLTGDGVRETLRILQRHAPIDIVETPSGAPAFDWTIPKEWNIRAAYIRDSQGRTVVDFRENNLHVVSYSVPVRRRMSLAELRPRLHSDPQHPDWIPYRTSYYKPDWGFCLTHRQLESLADGEYEVCIDSSLEDGSLTYGECYLPGDTPDELFLSTHVCHPSMCNDNLSGVVIAAFVANILSQRRRRHSARIVFVPGCIGAIAWLSRNEETATQIRHGMVITCIGDSGKFTYKRSRRGNAPIDRAAEHFLRQSGNDYSIADFTPYGYDERQYCSPGFNLPVGCFMRTPHGEFPEYHSSADNLDFIRPANLEESLQAVLAILDMVDRDGRWLNRNPKCEPQLGRRGLYRTTGGTEPGAADLARLWVLNFSDGDHSLLDIAERSGLPFSTIATAAEELSNVDLLGRPPYDRGT